MAPAPPVSVLLLRTLATVATAALLLCAYAARAQAPVTDRSPEASRVDSTVELTSAVVTNRRSDGAADGAFAKTWSSEQLAVAGPTSVGDALDRAGGHVRSYGPGMLSSLSVRGGNASQVLALWNGVPLVSPSLGLLDWSLLRPGPGTDLALTRGGNATLWGSGAVSATVALDATEPTDAHPIITLGADAGAFGEGGLRGAAEYGGEAWRARTSIDYRRADNDYPYLAVADRPDTELRQGNADLELGNLRQSLFFSPSERDDLEVHYWGLTAERGIAPTTVQNASTARQRDRAHRLTANWRRPGRTLVTTARAAYLHEAIAYRDPAGGITTDSDFDVLLGEALAALPLPGSSNHRVNFGTTVVHTRASVDEVYAGGRPTETKAALFASHAYRSPRLQLETSLRAEWVDGHAVPLSPTLGLSYALVQRPPGRLDRSASAMAVTLRARASRDYRLPTFNDRYWRPGGNPDLRPESGWSQELGIDVERGALRLGLTGFHRRLTDWMLWARRPGETFWSATNLAAVRSYGLEPRAAYAGTIGRFAFGLAGGYDYVRSVNLRELEAPRIGAGEQLWYVPQHSGFAQAELTGPGGWRLGYAHRWRGRSPGVNDDVPPSTDGDLRLSRTSTSPTQHRARLGGFVELRNVFDARIELIERRVLPGRHLRVGLELTIGRKSPAL